MNHTSKQKFPFSIVVNNSVHSHHSTLNHAVKAAVRFQNQQKRCYGGSNSTLGIFFEGSPVSDYAIEGALEQNRGK